MKKFCIFMISIVLLTGVCVGQSRLIRTVAGSDPVKDGGQATLAGLAAPRGVAVDTSGNLFVADYGNNRIRKVTAGGIISTAAGNSDFGFSGDGGQATLAIILWPERVAVDTSGNLYIADSGNNRIRKVNPGGTISTIAGSGAWDFSGDGGQATQAGIQYPEGLSVGLAGNLFFADSGNNRVRVIYPSGLIRTVAGTGFAGFSGDGGQATLAALQRPTGVAANTSGNLYIADRDNHRIRKVTPAGMMSTIAGTGSPGFSGDSGQATQAELQYPSGVAVDTSGNLYIADSGNHRIRMVTSEGIVSTVAGNGLAEFGGDGGQATEASLQSPSDVQVDSSGNLYIATHLDKRIRMVATGGIISTIAGKGTFFFGGDGGPATQASLWHPYGVVRDSSGNTYFTDADNSRIRKITPAGTISTIAGTGTFGFSGDGGPATQADLWYPADVALDSSGNLYIADAGNYRVRMIDSGGNISTYVGNGTFGYSGDGGQATQALLNFPAAIVFDSSDNLYIADNHNHRIRMVTPAGIISTVAGNGSEGFGGDGGQATQANIYYPEGVALDFSGNLYISDEGNNRIRMVTPGGIISTIAGNGELGSDGDGGPATQANLLVPRHIALDAVGNLYIADEANNRIRKVTTEGIISTVAGTGTHNFAGDGGPATAADLAYPRGLTISPKGRLLIADTGNSRLRKVQTGLAAAADFDSDDKIDFSVWRNSTGYWYSLLSESHGVTGTQWGSPSDIPVSGDYDGDGKVDNAVWRPASGDWFVLLSGTPGNYSSNQWGQTGDIPVPGDYDGDGKTDIAVWRPDNGTWFILLSGWPGFTTITQWGNPTDIPVPGDYDHDGKTDIAVWRPSEGVWYILFSGSPGNYIATQWGLSADIPVPGDYDGDGKTDIAVWRGSSATWFVLPSASPGTFTSAQWGASTDKPAAGDFDGDGRTDIAVWRPGTGTWFSLLSATPGSYTAQQWGQSGDIPISEVSRVVGSIP